jgi:hypothetical protein
VLLAHPDPPHELLAYGTLLSFATCLKCLCLFVTLRCSRRRRARAGSGRGRAAVVPRRRACGCSATRATRGASCRGTARRQRCRSGGRAA